MKIPYIYKPCVYMLLNFDEVVYIGKTDSNVYSRIGEHKTKKQFNRIEVEEFDTPDQVMAREAELIFKHRPRYNSQVENSKLSGRVSRKAVKEKFKTIDMRIVHREMGLRGMEIERIGRCTYYKEEDMDALALYFKETRA
jgi:predicted GIY-YIG superfamily endonuclease